MLFKHVPMDAFLQFLINLDPCRKALPTVGTIYGPLNPEPPSQSLLPIPQIFCGSGRLNPIKPPFGGGPFGPGGPQGPNGRAPPLGPPPNPCVQAFPFDRMAMVGVPGKSPAVRQAPINSSAFEHLLLESASPAISSRLRVVLGPVVEELHPWTWALTFMTTQWVTPTITNSIVTFQFDNVTAWAGSTWMSPEVQKVVLGAHRAAESQKPWVCYDDSFPVAECNSRAAKSKWRSNREDAVKGNKGYGNKRPAWLIPLIATVITFAVVSACPLPCTPVCMSWL
jgi:hypothetical protein